MAILSKDDAQTILKPYLVNKENVEDKSNWGNLPELNK